MIAPLTITVIHLFLYCRYSLLLQLLLLLLLLYFSFFSVGRKYTTRRSLGL